MYSIVNKKKKERLILVIFFIFFCLEIFLSLKDKFFNFALHTMEKFTKKTFICIYNLI